jgi:hypothetical protein
MKTKQKWIPKHIKSGALHGQMHIPLSEHIPLHYLDDVIRTSIGHKVEIDGNWVTVTHLLKERAVFTKNARKFKHHHK